MPIPKINLPQNWVLPLSFIFLAVLLAIVEIPMLRFSDGLVVYPLDEAYIRMATAKNLADHGIWGLSLHEFASTSSSILFPILLAACFKMFGPQTIIPLVINLVIAIVFLISLQRWLQKQNITPFYQLLITLTIIFLTPLHVMVVNGMEHALQILLCFWFIIELCTWLSFEKDATESSLSKYWRPYLYAFLLTAIRYEGLFLVAIAGIALLFQRKWIPAFLLVAAGLLPIILFGIYSMAHDGYFIPNSILIKSIILPLNGERIGNFFKEDIVNRLFYLYPTRGAVATGRLLILLPLVYWHYYSKLKTNKLYRYILYAVLTATVLHLVFADANLYYRYEAYLIACGLVVPAVLMSQLGIPLISIRKGGARWIVAWTMIFLLYPLFSRGWAAHQETEYGFLHEYQYNYQAARFLHAYYNDATVVMDEVGMASFLSTGRKLDVMTGIVYKDITQTRIDGFTRVEYVNFLLKRDKPAIALIADKKYNPWLIQGWTKVAAWYTSYRLPLGETELDFYAVDPGAASALRANLKAFQGQMPPGIKVVF